MMENIQSILSNISQKKNIRIVYACETGSRAWGFPSPDSDYDIRFIYVHDKDWYLSLSQKKDTIEHMDGDLDITGWDLKKSLTLLKKSNATLIERFQSPMEYYAAPGFKDDFKKLIENYYSPTAVFFHHHSLAKKFWEEIKDKEEFKLKSFFYLVRSLLSCNWIIQDKSVLPMHIEGLMQYTEQEIKDQLRALIKLKAGVGEKYLHEKEDILNEWISEKFESLEKAGQNLGVSRSDMGLLNEFFLKILYAKTDN
jgi:predicted nucleotidyltransferase